MRISKERGAEIIAAYQDWDGAIGVEAFAQQFGITKQSLYGLLRREGIPTKTEAAFQNASKDGASTTGEVADWLIDKVAEQALRTILTENRQVHRLEDRIEALEAYMREHALDPDDV